MVRRRATRRKNVKYIKSLIDCGFGGNCVNEGCPFKHPDGWDYAASQRRIHEENQRILAQWMLRQTELARLPCGNLCAWQYCPRQHPPGWDPIRNQEVAEATRRHEAELFELRRRRDEQRREQERQHAVDVSTKETITGYSELEKDPPAAKTIQKHAIGDEYEYDSTYFDIQEKIAQRESRRHQDDYY